ncbi:MAG: lipoprotein-releasing ABC transporter permease subunit [Gammaproteobacteria bacterium]
MFKPLSLYIGLRYTRTKRHNHYISFISLVSMLGIALGVAVLITVLSVMNGFDKEIHERFFSLAPQMTVTNYQERVNDWQSVQQQVAEYPGVIGVAPFIGSQGLLTHFDEVLPVMVSGILPQQESAISDLADTMTEGRVEDLRAGEFGMIVGRVIAQQLNLSLGDKITLMIPEATPTPAGLLPRFKRFTLVGLFTAGDGFDFDRGIAFIHLNDAQRLFRLDDAVTGLQVRIDDIYAAPQMSLELMQQLPEGSYVGNWTQKYGALFSAIKLEKTMMFLILILIIAVAAFNLVSSLVMVVNDKQADIAILRTLGAEPRMILAIFMVQGSLVGIIGTFLGLVGGLLLAYNATAIVDILQNLLQTQFLSSSVYFIDYLPSKIELTDIIKICMLALALSFLATIYPAWRASRVQPAEALRYE